MKYKILELLKENKDFVSGQEIAHKFNVSRTAIWKNISRLKEEGYNIVSVSNRGYKLEGFTDILNENEIKYRPLRCFSELDSTNNMAKELAYGGCERGMLVVCDSQSAGKGRLGRSWQSKKGEGLYMSVVLRPDILPSEAPQLTLVAGIACVKAINYVTGLDCRIKWPNDVIVNGKKLVGILTEMNAEIEMVKYVVTGIGINVNNEYFSDEIKEKATSIYIETGEKYKRGEIADRVMTEFKALYNVFCSKGFEALMEEYNSMCINVGMKVRTFGRKEIQGVAKGVNKNGELLIQTDKGIETVLSGEVSLRLKDKRYI